jgi:hypothetical protein
VEGGVAETGERVYELVDVVKKVERLQVILWRLEEEGTPSNSRGMKHMQALLNNSSTVATCDYQGRKYFTHAYS